MNLKFILKYGLDIESKWEIGLKGRGVYFVGTLMQSGFECCV